jgi:hypothetical protein
MFTMKSKVVGHLRWVMTLFKVLTKNLSKTVLHNFRTFMWISTVLYNIITVGLDHHKLWTRLVPKMLMGAHKTLRMALAWTFFREMSQRWRLISLSHRTSDRWWNLGFICECWNRKAVKAVDAHTFNKQAEKSLNKRLPASKLTKNVFWNGTGPERSADDTIRATRDHNDVRSVLQNKKKVCRAIQQKKAWNADIQ